MTHEEEFETMVGDLDEERVGDLCRRCNDYPCRCLIDLDDPGLYDEVEF